MKKTIHYHLMVSVPDARPEEQVREHLSTAVAATRMPFVIREQGTLQQDKPSRRQERVSEGPRVDVLNRPEGKSHCAPSSAGPRVPNEIANVEPQGDGFDRLRARAAEALRNGAEHTFVHPDTLLELLGAA